jgi:hypothetical protein
MVINYEIFLMFIYNFNCHYKQFIENKLKKLINLKILLITGNCSKLIIQGAFEFQLVTLWNFTNFYPKPIVRNVENLLVWHLR